MNTNDLSHQLFQCARGHWFSSDILIVGGFGLQYCPECENGLLRPVGKVIRCE